MQYQKVSRALLTQDVQQGQPYCEQHNLLMSSPPSTTGFDPESQTIDPRLLTRPGALLPSQAIAADEAGSQDDELLSENSDERSDNASSAMESIAQGSDGEKTSHKSDSIGSSEPEIRKYYHLRPGHGGVFRLPMKWMNLDGEEEDIYAIGTDGSLTCVSVYIPLDNNGLCFAAHMSAWDGEHDETDDSKKWVPLDDEYILKLKEHFRAKLKLVCPKLVEAGLPTISFELAAITCARPTVQGLPATGTYIIEVIREVFGIDKPAYHNYHGFIFDEEAELYSPHYFQWKRGDGKINVPLPEGYYDRMQDVAEGKIPRPKGKMKLQEQRAEDFSYVPCNDREWNLQRKENGEWCWLSGEY